MMDEYETSRITKIRRLSEVNLATVTIYTDDLRLLLSLFERSQQENAKLRAAMEGLSHVPANFEYLPSMTKDVIIRQIVSAAWAALKGEG